MKVIVESQPKATIKLTVTVPNDKVKEIYENLLDVAVEQTAVEGFRKGKAPRDIVKDKVGSRKLYSDLIHEVLVKFYPQAIKENHVSAIGNPKVDIKTFDIDKDLEFTATVPTRPEVTIEEYMPALKDHYAKRNKQLSIDNQEKIKKGEKVEQDHIHMGTNEIIDVLLGKAQVEVSDILVEEETDRMMARLIDQAQSLGLSIDQYLNAQNKTADQLKKDYTIVAERNLKAEFILAKLINNQNIEVTDNEIEEMIKASGIEDVQQRMDNPMEKFYVKSILQKNKLLTNLLEEVEGGKHNHDH